MAEIFNKLTLDTIKLNKQELLRKLDRLIFENASASLKDMDDREASEAVSQKIEQCMKQGTIINDFKYFAEKFSDGTVKLEDTDTIKRMVAKIMESKDVIEKNIDAM